MRQSALLLFLICIVCLSGYSQDNMRNPSYVLSSIERRIQYSDSDFNLDAYKLVDEATRVYKQIQSPKADDIKSYLNVMYACLASFTLKSDVDATKRSLDTLLQVLEDNHAFAHNDYVANMLVGIPGYAAAAGQDELARSFLNELLAIYSKSDTDSIPYAMALYSYAAMLNNGAQSLAKIFARLALDMSQRLEVAGYYRHMLDILSNSLNGEIAYNEKKYEVAYKFFDEAYASVLLVGDEIYEFYGSHLLIFKLECLERLGRYEELSDNLLNVVDRVTSEVMCYAGLLNSYQREKWLKSRESFLLHRMPFYASRTNDLRSLDAAYNSQLLVKGLSLNIDVNIDKIVSELKDASLIQQYDDICQLERDIAQLRYSLNTAAVVQKEHEIKEEQSKLLLALRNYGINPTAGLVTDWKDIRDVLKSDEAAIEFIVFGQGDYGCLLVKKGSEHPQYVKLFQNHYWEKRESETKTIWDTIMPYIDGVKTVYFSPVGDLHRMSIENSDSDVARNLNLVRVSSTRELVLKRSFEGYKAINIGGIDYGNMSTTDTNRKLPAGCYINSPNRLGFLPGTQAEAVSISEYINGSEVGLFKGVSAQLVTGREATEDYFKGLSGRHVRFLHIGTHAFYSDKSDESVVNDVYSMNRSGLFLADANKSINSVESYFSSEEDGVLTAAEIASLDFRDMEMVSLSACETGLGDISSEGVYGLQRGFKKAGVGTILMSLWPVNDEATSLLMTAFYKNIANGNTKYDALELAKKGLRDNPKFNDKMFWGAFVLVDAIDK